MKLTSRGPALYLQLRMGRNGKPFPIYKIRTMHYQCEKKSGAQWSTPGDSRILPLGRWLRRMHIDELPQLWNVIRGDMSLIGPRPERPEFVPQLEQAIAHYGQRLLLRPGVTGLAQVQLPADTDLNSVRTKLAYDLYYLRQRRLLARLAHLRGHPLQDGVGSRSPSSAAVSPFRCGEGSGGVLPEPGPGGILPDAGRHPGRQGGLSVVITLRVMFRRRRIRGETICRQYSRWQSVAAGFACGETSRGA